MAFMGSQVTGGQGLAVVVATGRNTEIGQLQMLLGEITSPETPIERQLGQLGDQLVIMCGVICGIVFLMGFLRGYGILQMLRMAISLAAAAVPEGLPAAATINFALGIKKMKSHGVLIRQLQAVETLGAIQTICMDKTGTITQNRMTVQKIYSGHMCVITENGDFKSGETTVDLSEHEEFRRLFNVCALCNESTLEDEEGGVEKSIFGSPTENALLLAAMDAGVDVSAVRSEHEQVKLNHRSESRLFMSTLHNREDGQKIYSVKGSPPEVLAMCKWQIIADEIVPLTEESIQEIETENEKMAAGHALRVLGFAYKEVDEDFGEKEPADLVWVGIIGMSDPIRDGVNGLIKVFHHAGIDTVMITGDQHSTAQAVAGQLDIAREGPLEILDSSELSALGPEVLEAIAKKVHVYSRVSPAHKLRIVQALQSAGKTVAMTGDGVNDGPALKAADIGIAMGRSGTDVARGVADVVLEEDNLEKLIVAVKDGRTMHNNVRKSVHFFLATNLSEIMIMFSSMAMGVGFPLNVMQLLWINIISDVFPGLALSMEEPEQSAMDKPPRDPKASLFSKKDFRRMTMESAVITAGAMGAYGFGIARYGMGARAGGIAFQSLTLAQLLHAFSCRSEDKSIFEKDKLSPNRYLNVALGASLGVQALTLFFPPLRNFLGVPRLSLLDTLVIGGSSVLPLFVNEMTKHRG
jgi:Ca2+-transporting ATPase